MADPTSLSFHFADPEETAAFAARLAPDLVPGDVILLEGDVGAGKTHFARSLIRARLDPPEDIPSPTFTLVQTYAGDDVEIWHADLYRLTSTQEVEELGLAEAFETAICLVEWPDRLGPLAPADALTLHLAVGDGDAMRRMTARWQSGRWADRLNRAAA